MSDYICPKCGSMLNIGVETSIGGEPNHTCSTCGSSMIEQSNVNPCSKTRVKIGENATVKMGSSRVNIGGDLENKGKMKLWDTELNVKGTLKQDGEFLINDPERIKESLLEISKSTKNVTEIGTMVAKKIFGWGI